MERNGVLEPTHPVCLSERSGYLWCCACPIHCKMHKRVVRRLGSCRFISAQPFECATIREFSIKSSVLWVLEVPCCLCWPTFYQIDHSSLWLMIVGANWLTLCQEYCRAVFLAHYCSSCRPRSFLPLWKMPDLLCRWHHFDSWVVTPLWQAPRPFW